MPASINLLNEKFGNWLVINKAESINGKTYWECQCQICKKIQKIQTCHLRNNTYPKCCEFSNIKKICPICNKEFYPLIKGSTRKFCFECSPYYNQEKGRSQNITAIRRAIKKRLVDYKGGKCCICGYCKSINALQFHHLDSEDKEFTISHNLVLNNFNIEDYYKEVDKCILVCANCHAELHDKEMDNKLI